MYIYNYYIYDYQGWGEYVTKVLVRVRVRCTSISNEYFIPDSGSVRLLATFRDHGNAKFLGFVAPLSSIFAIILAPKKSFYHYYYYAHEVFAQPYTGGVDLDVRPHNPTLVVWTEVYDHTTLHWWCGPRCTTTQPYTGGVDRGVRPHNPTLVVWTEVIRSHNPTLVVWTEVYDHTTLHWWCGLRCTTTQSYTGGVDRGVRPHNPTLGVWTEVYDHITIHWRCGPRCTTTQPYTGGMDRGVRPYNPTLGVLIEMYDNDLVQTIID